MTSNDPFSRSHPLVNFVFFVAMLGISMFCLHPVILAISIISAVVYGVVLKGWRHILKLAGFFIVPGMLIVAVLNPVFNHNGVTMLFTLSNGNSVTLEAIIYGVVLASTLAAATLWFVALNAVLTRDKFVYLFGRLLPTGALILAMSFRFIPLFVRQFHATVTAQRYLGRDLHTAKLWNKVCIALSVTSALFTWSLENAVHVSDSMQARSYGQHRRSSYAPYRWDRTNIALVAAMIALAAMVALSVANGGLVASYDPTIIVSGLVAALPSGWTWVGALSFALLANLPVAMRSVEKVQWHRYEARLHARRAGALPSYFAGKEADHGVTERA